MEPIDEMHYGDSWRARSSILSAVDFNGRNSSLSIKPKRAKGRWCRQKRQCNGRDRKPFVAIPNYCVSFEGNDREKCGCPSSEFLRQRAVPIKGGSGSFSG
jgi:hypothetical protein